MANFTQLWILHCIILVAPAIVASHHYCEKFYYKDQLSPKGQIIPHLQEARRCFDEQL